MSFREPSVKCTLPSCSFIGPSSIKRKTAERLNAACIAENSRLITEHGVLDLLGTEPIHGLVWGQTLMRRRRCLTRRVMLPQLFAVHKKVDSTNLTAAVQTFEGPLAFCPGVSRAGVLPDSPRRLLRRSSLRIIASAISRMDLRRCRLSRCMAL